MLSSATKIAANVTKASAENDVRNTVKDFANAGRDTVNDAVDSVADYANEAGQKFRSFVDRKVDQGRGVGSNVQSEIESNPVRSAIIALGAGFILGAILTRR